MLTLAIEKMSKSTPKQDFLDLGNEDKYPKPKKLYNFYIKRYVFLDIKSHIEEIDIYNLPFCPRCSM